MCQCLHQGHPCEWLKGNLLVKEPEKEKKTWPTQQAQIQVSKTYRKSSNQKISISNCAEEAWGLSKQGGCRRTIWWPHCFCVLHHSTGVLRSGGTLASFWSLALQGVRGPVGKYILFPNETTPKSVPLCPMKWPRGLWLPWQSMFVSPRLILQNWSEIRYQSLHKMSVGSTEVSQNLLGAHGSKAVLVPSVISSPFKPAPWWIPGSTSLDLHCPNKYPHPIPPVLPS